MLQATPSLPGVPLYRPNGPSGLHAAPSRWLPAVTARDRRLQLILALTLVLNLFDAIFTLFAVRAGYAIETNPLMQELLHRGPLAFMLGKMLMVSLGILLLWRLRRLKMALVGSLTAFLTYAAIVVWHLHGLGTIWA